MRRRQLLMNRDTPFEQPFLKIFGVSPRKSWFLESFELLPHCLLFLPLTIGCYEFQELLSDDLLLPRAGCVINELLVIGISCG